MIQVIKFFLCFVSTDKTNIIDSFQNALNSDLTTCEPLLICFEDVENSNQDTSNTMDCASERGLLSNCLVAKERVSFIQPYHYYYEKVCRLLYLGYRQ